MIVHHSNAARVVANVDREPYFLQGERSTLGQEMSLVAETGENLIHHAFTVINHAEPSETRHVSDFARNTLVRTGARVADAKTFVAAENKNP